MPQLGDELETLMQANLGKMQPIQLNEFVVVLIAIRPGIAIIQVTGWTSRHQNRLALSGLHGRILIHSGNLLNVLKSGKV